MSQEEIQEMKQERYVGKCREWLLYHRPTEGLKRFLDYEDENHAMRWLFGGQGKAMALWRARQQLAKRGMKKKDFCFFLISSLSFRLE